MKEYLIKLLKQEIKESYKTFLKILSEKNNDIKDFDMPSYRQDMTVKQLDKFNKCKESNDTVTAIKIIKQARKKYYAKLFKRKLKVIELIVSANDFKYAVCYIDWVRNSTWGMCPRGTYKNGYNFRNYKSITGYGYDKLSTLTANMFNEDLNLMKLVYNKLYRYNINKNNIQDKLGYGIRISYGVPYFEGAVGVECHIKILKNLGLIAQHLDTRKTDYITIDRVR